MMSETKERTPFEREVDKKFMELEERIDLKISKIQNGLDAILLRMDEFMIGMRYTGSPVTPRLPVAETEDEIEVLQTSICILCPNKSDLGFSLVNYRC